MKKTTLKLTAIVTCMAASLLTHGQWANRSLSNLLTTSINKSLLPNTDNTKNLGSTSTSWKDIYLDGSLYLNGIAMVRAQHYASETFFGWEAGVHQPDTPGHNNSAFGYRALWQNKTGVFNTAIGFEALAFNVSGGANNAVGYAALHANNNGEGNNAVGDNALYSNTSGHNNCSFGTSSLLLNNGDGNAAYGTYSLLNNVSGKYNIAIGFASLYKSQNNSHNVAIGDSALYNYNDGSLEDHMVGIGFNAMKNNTTGYYNTAVGGEALLSNTGGHDNTCLGTHSMVSNTIGKYNTAFGSNSLLNNITGSSNTALGTDADVNTSNRFNATAIGYGALALNNSQVMLGNTSVTSVWAAGVYMIYSDGRFKKNIKENVPGLDFINKLRPVTYQYDVHGMNKHISPEYSKLTKNNDGSRLDKNNDNRRSASDETAINSKEKKIYTGFIAQEVEAAANNLTYDFSGVYKPSDEKDLYGLSYSDFVVPLVKAVQELSKQNELQQKEIDELKAIVISCNQNNTSLTTNDKLQTINALLEQNTPNPFNQSTTIRYSLPPAVRSAKIVVTDYAGKALKQVNIATAGKGTINIEAHSLSSGTYNYSLIIDDKLIETKKMVVMK